MKYKGYTGVVEFDEESGALFGHVIGLRDGITFQGDSVAEVIQAFHDSVDDYLEFCAERGESPEKPYSGQFVLRIDPRLHRVMSHAAEERGASLNSLDRRTAQGVIRPRGIEGFRFRKGAAESKCRSAVFRRGKGDTDRGGPVVGKLQGAYAPSRGQGLKWRPLRPQVSADRTGQVRQGENGDAARPRDPLRSRWRAFARRTDESPGRLRLGSARFERRRSGPSPAAPLAKPAGGRTGPNRTETPTGAVRSEKPRGLVRPESACRPAPFGPDPFDLV